MVSDKRKQRKAPARSRYEASHPTVSCRLDKDTYHQLQKRLNQGKISFGSFVRSALGDLQLKMPDTEEVRNQAYREGYNEGFEEAAGSMTEFDLGTCGRCGKPLHWDITDKDDRQLLAQAMNGQGFIHSRCE